MSGTTKQNPNRQSGTVGPVASATKDSGNPTKTTNPSSGVGAEWINTTTGQIFICINATTDANEWIGQTNTNIGSFGLFGGGQSGGAGTQVNTIDYITIPTTGNATDFGDLTNNQTPAGTSNGINDRAVWGGGHDGSGYVDTIQYNTISIPGNGTDFGNLQQARGGGIAGCSNGSNERGIFAGGHNNDDEIDYITISTPGNGTDFGDLTQGRYGVCGADNGTNERGVFAGGWNGNKLDTIDYITINSAGNAIDFGNLLASGFAAASCSNNTNDRAVFAGLNPDGTYLNTIQYITITSTGNATDFGDLSGGRAYLTGLSNGTGERGCWGGGTDTSAAKLNTIEYITISTPGNTTDFGDLTQARASAGGASNGAS